MIEHAQGIRGRVDERLLVQIHGRVEHASEAGRLVEAAHETVEEGVIRLADHLGPGGPVDVYHGRDSRLPLEGHVQRNGHEPCRMAGSRALGTCEQGVETLGQDGGREGHERRAAEAFVQARG